MMSKPYNWKEDLLNPSPQDLTYGQVLALQMKLKDFLDKSENLEQKLAIAVEALEFYQARSNVPITELVDCLNKQISTGHILDGYCKKSREALAKIRGQG